MATAMSDAETQPVAAPEPPPAAAETGGKARLPARWWPAVAIALGGALLLVVALVATAPAWAPLLPWGPAASDRAGELDLAARLDRLEAAQRDAQRQASRDAATAGAALQQIETRLAALATRQTAPADEVSDLRRQLTTLSGGMTDLGGRLDALAKAMHTQTANGATDVGLALAVIQIRNAVAAGQPFAASYATLAALARSRPDIASAAAPLAGPATSGVASRAALADGLRQLAAAVAAGNAAPPATNSWRAAILARLRGLVTIRRVDGTTAAPEAAVDDARQRFAAGDLGGAIAALDKLSGASAAAAAPWLQRARRRLAVEAALRQVEALTTARLGAASGAGPSP
jgi:hypothetical protein